jgi:hypothetical protein
LPRDNVQYHGPGVYSQANAGAQALSPPASVALWHALLQFSLHAWQLCALSFLA